LNEGVTSLIVASRLAILTISLVTLAKWFPRNQLSLVYGFWITNEGLAQFINMRIKRDENLYIISGSLMVALSFVLLRYYRVDPIDAGLILNEQAINVTSQYSDEVRSQLSVSEFVNELRTDPKRADIYRTQFAGSNSIKV
jgi:hypothetical protein